MSHIHITKSSIGWILQTEQFFPFPVEELFSFFGDAENLEAITPPWLHFEVLTPRPIVMAAGTLIDYKLRLRWIPIRWRTEITAWEPPFRFVDSQLRGPYKKWIHEHSFVEQRNGTLMTDRVEYAVPCGALVHELIVRSDLERIFSYRRHILEQHFQTLRPDKH